MTPAPLPPPDAALARRLLAPVAWDDRLTVGRLRPPVGLLPSEVRGLVDLELFLAPDEAWLPGVDQGAMAAWVERVLGDAALAGALREACAAAPNFVDGCVRCYLMVRARAAQARAALAAGEAIA